MVVSVFGPRFRDELSAYEDVHYLGFFTFVPSRTPASRSAQNQISGAIPAIDVRRYLGTAIPSGYAFRFDGVEKPLHGLSFLFSGVI